MHPLRQFMRQNTAAEHQALDRMLAPLNLRQRSDFAQFLQIHHMALGAITPGWARSDLIDIAALLDLLRRDLTTMGETPATLPDPVVLPEPAQIGAGYVLAGSYFGKLMSQRQWQGSTDPLVRRAGGFIRSDDLKLAWPAVTRAMETAADHTALLHGARQTFATFAQAAHRCITP